MKIENQNYLPQIQPEGRNLSTRQFQQVSAFSQQNDITIKTAEGDTITLSSDFGSAFSLDRTREQTKSGQMTTFTASTLQYENLTFEVEGDLNSEELSDVKHLFKDLFATAKHFFDGNINAAFNGAQNLGKHMGSIAEVSATFSQTSMISASAYGEYHPTADFQEAFSNNFIDGTEIENTENIINDMLRSQWEQIANILHLTDDDYYSPFSSSLDEGQLADNNFLENLAVPLEDIIDTPKPQDLEELPPSNLPTSAEMLPTTLAEHAEKMMEQITETLQKHPRLSPFAVPLTENAIEQAADSKHNGNKTDFLANQLKRNFMKEFDKWLLG